LSILLGELGQAFTTRENYQEHAVLRFQVIHGMETIKVFLDLLNQLNQKVVISIQFT